MDYPVEDVIIVTKNLDQIKWLNNHGIFGKIKSKVTAEEAKGKHIIGPVPYIIAAVAKDISLIDCKPMGKIKSKDMSAKQLEAQGAELRTYKVEAL